MTESEILLAHSWVVWLLISVIALIIELSVPSFSFIFAAIAGATSAIVAVFLPWPFQLAAFVVALGLSLTMGRTRLVQRLHLQQHLPSRADRLRGQTGLITSAIDALTPVGRVNVEGEDWAAQTAAPLAALLASPLPIGTLVEVISSDGIVLIVQEHRPEARAEHQQER